MSFARLLSYYLSLNLLVLLAYAFLRGTEWIFRRAGRPLSSRYELRTHYLVLSSLLLIGLLQPLFPRSEIFQPAAKIWSAQSIKTFSRDYSAADQGGYLTLPSASGLRTIPADHASSLLLGILIVLLSTGIYRLGRDLRALRAIQRGSFLIRRIGRVSVFSNDEIQVPFSWWFPFQAKVVLPSSLLSKPLDTRMALAHELQHHRQADTLWVYLIWAIQILCAVNPAIHLWTRWLSEIQEFACDETLVDRNKVKSRQYARCLIEVAQSAFRQKHVPACATGLVFLVERNLLKRRIEKMFSKTTRPRPRRMMTHLISGFTIALMAVTAFASQGLVQDRRVSMSEARVMAEKARSDSGFPIAVNALVLKQLNRYIGTPEGREYMRKTLRRMEAYRTLVETKIKDYDVPLELMAIPIIESGYENLDESGIKGHGAGLWMFIKQTARNYGLRVDDQVDERLAPEAETDAAMRLLKADRLLFKDWLLSVLAYNVGEQGVQRAIRETNSRDAWVLIQNGHENDRDYLPRMMAAVLILRNPSTVQ